MSAGRDGPRGPRGLLALVPLLALLGCPDPRPGSSGGASAVPSGASPRAATITVAAAADLAFALDELLAAFRAAHPDTRVQVSYGSSGSFYAQLVNQAPFDLYLSADVAYPRRLAEAGHGLEPPFLYAYGRIVVWAPSSSPIDVERLGAQALLDPAAVKVAIANPRHAPYGRAAEAALRSLGLYEQVAPRLVLGENIAQTAQFVDTGNADLGVIALSLALSPPLRQRGKWWRVPEQAYPPLEQGGLILRWARDPSAARELQRFLTGPEGRAVLERYGFGLPPG